MLKYLIGLLVIVIIFKISTDNVSTSKTDSQPIQRVTIEEEKNCDIPIAIINEDCKASKEDNNRSILLNKLWNQANTAFNKTQDEEALEIYDELLKFIGESKDFKELKILAKVYFKKAILYQLYPNTDIDLAKENYHFVIKKFENSENIELLNLYIDAKQQLANLLGRDEQIELYDELIARFQDNPAFATKIEEILFNESFLLAGKDDERAMEVLDTLIQKYKDKNENVKLPSNIQNSIINNIELAIITNSDDDDYRELADKYMENEPDTKPLLDMLEIVRNAQDYEQSELLEQWNNNHSDYKFPDWSFQELKRWAYQMESPEAQSRVLDYINNFERRKYSNRYSNQSTDQAVQANSSSSEYDTASASVIYENDKENSTPIVYPNLYGDSVEVIDNTIYNSDGTITYTPPEAYEPSEEALYYQDAHSGEEQGSIIYGSPSY